MRQDNSTPPSLNRIRTLDGGNSAQPASLSPLAGRLLLKPRVRVRQTIAFRTRGTQLPDHDRSATAAKYSWCTRLRTSCSRASNVDVPAVRISWVNSSTIACYRATRSVLVMRDTLSTCSPTIWKRP
jgi:hypothetical protein